MNKNQSTYLDSTTVDVDSEEQVPNEYVKRDTDFYKSKGYQVFEEYQFAVKCPVTLEDFSLHSNSNFDFNYAGLTEKSFYQIMIIKIPVGHLEFSKVEQKKILQEMFSNQGGGERVSWGEDRLPAYLLNDYVQNGYKGRGIAVVRGSIIFTFNVMTKDKLDIVFNSFTNNVHFFD